MFRLKLWNSKSDDDHTIFVKAAALDFNFISQGNSLLKLQALASCDRPKFSKKPRSTSDVLTGTQFLYWHFWPICQDFCPAILTIQAFWPTVALLANSLGLLLDIATIYALRPYMPLLARPQ